MRNFILQSFNGKINLLAKKSSTVGAFTHINSEKPNQFATELSQFMEATPSHNISDIENSQNDILNTLPPSLDGKTDNPDLKQQKYSLLKAFNDKNIPINNNSDLPEISLPQNKQDKLVSDQPLLAGNISYKAIAENEKNDKSEPISKNDINIEKDNQFPANISENIILSAMTTQFTDNIVTKKNPELQDYKQPDKTPQNLIKPLLSDQKILKIELKSEPLDNNSLTSLSQNPTETNPIESAQPDQRAIQKELKSEQWISNDVPSVSLTQSATTKNPTDFILTDQKTIQLKLDSIPLTDNDISPITTSQNEILKIDDEKVKIDKTLVSQDKDIIQSRNELKLEVSNQIPSTKLNNAKIINQETFVNEFTNKIPIDTKVISINNQNSIDVKDTKYKEIQKPKEQEAYESKSLTSQVYTKENKIEDFSVITSDTPIQEKSLLTSQPTIFYQDSIQKPFESVKTLIIPDNIMMIRSDKENKQVEQYEHKQKDNQIQNLNTPIKLESKQVLSKAPETYSSVDISALKTSIIVLEDSNTSAIKQAEFNSNSTSTEYTQLIKSESKLKSQKMPSEVNAINKSNTKVSEITSVKNKMLSNNLIERGQSDKMIPNVSIQIKNESTPFLSQIKDDNTLENVSVAKSNKNDIQDIWQVERANTNELVKNPQIQVKSETKVVYHELPQSDKIKDDQKLVIKQTKQEQNNKIDIRMVSKADQKPNAEKPFLVDDPITPQVKQEQNTKTDLPITVKADQKPNAEKPFLVDDPITPQVKQEQNTKTDLPITVKADQKISSNQSLPADNIVSKPAPKLSEKTSVNVTLENVDNTYENNTLIQNPSDKKTSEWRSNHSQIIKTQTVTDNLSLNKSGFQSDNENTQDRQENAPNQIPARDNQEIKSNYKSDFSVELGETLKYSKEQANSSKLIENQNVKIDKGQQDNYVQEKPIQRSSNSVVEQDQSSKLDLSKDSENNSQAKISDTNSKQDTKGSILQEPSQIGHERRLNIEHNMQKSKVENIETNNLLSKDNVIKDKSFETIPTKIEKFKEANIEKAPEKFDVSLSKLNNEFITTQKTDVKTIPVVDKNEMASKVVELPDKIAQYVSTVKNDTKPHSVMIQLEPAHLGKIRLKVTMKDDRLIAEMNVARLVTKEMIEAQLPDIKRSLMQCDVQVSVFNVTLDNGSSKFSSYNPNTSRQDKSSESWGYNQGNEQNKNNQENAKRYMRYINNESMVDILT